MDGRELREIKRDSLSALIGTVSQEPFFFQDTIRNNITLYDESYRTSDIEAAMEQAGLKGFLAALPQGLATVITENGKNLSGGERQRLSLASSSAVPLSRLAVNSSSSRILLPRRRALARLAGMSPKMRIGGELFSMNCSRLTAADMLDILIGIMPEALRDRFEEKGEAPDGG